MKLWLSLLFLLSDYALAIAPQALVVPIDLPRSAFLPKDRVKDAEVRDDIEVLIQTIQRAYGGWVPFKKQFENEIFPGLRQLKGSTHKVAVISIVRGALDTSEGWKGFLERAREIYIHSDSLIIDLRGNDGGDDTKIEQFARIIYGINDEKIQLEPNGKVIRRQTPESYALYANTFGFALLKDKWSKKALRKDVAGYRADFLQLLDLSSKDHLSDEGVTQTDDTPIGLKNAFKGPIRILTDGLCASACENGIEFFERLPNVRRVGENTAGLVQFGNVGTLFLKHSRVVVNMPTQRYEFADNRFVEKVGYSPHTQVDSNQDALEVALKQISEI